MLPIDSRCCFTHLNEENYIKDEELKNIIIYDESIELNSENLNKIFEAIRNNHNVPRLYRFFKR